MSIVVVGSIAYDTVITPYGRRDHTLGGAATFFSVAASYFCPVQVVGVVGDVRQSGLAEAALPEIYYPVRQVPSNRRAYAVRVTGGPDDAMPGIAATVDFDHIKRHYYGSHKSINPTGIVPLGPSDPP